MFKALGFTIFRVYYYVITNYNAQVCILQIALHNIKLPLCYHCQLLTSGQRQLHLFLTNESFYVYIKHIYIYIYILQKLACSGFLRMWSCC